MAEFDCDDNIQDDDIVTITLEFDDGTSEECEVIGTFDFEDREYAALAPLDEDSEDVYLYECTFQSDDEFQLLDIEDDELFNRVAAEFDRLLDEIDEGEED